jgi:hypothetical protein
MLLTAVAGGQLFVITVLLAAMADRGLSVVILLSPVAAVGTMSASWTIADLGDAVAGNNGIEIVFT